MDSKGGAEPHQFDGLVKKSADLASSLIYSKERFSKRTEVKKNKC
jgi:hypothetical protein